MLQLVQCVLCLDAMHTWHSTRCTFASLKVVTIWFCPRIVPMHAHRSNTEMLRHRGTSGFVQLALDMQTGQHVAVKFISRGRQHVDVNMKEISRELLVSDLRSAQRGPSASRRL